MTRPFPGVEGYGSAEMFTSGSIKTLELANLLGLVLVELRLQSEMMREAFSVRDETSALREAAFTANYSTAEIAPSLAISNPS